MTPNQMQAQAQAMLDLYAQAEELMLGRVAKRLARGVDGEGWAEQKLREAAQMRTVIAGELRRLNDQSQAMREEMLGAAYESGAAAFEGEYAARVTTGGPVGERTPQGRLNAVARVVEELDAKFTALHSAVLRDVDDSYRRIIGNAVAMQVTGAITTREAVKQALNQFADRGITGYTDKAGRRWNMDSYAEMAVRTGMMRAAVQGYTDDAVDHGEDLVIVSDHMDTCPLCADWERSVLSLTGAMANHPECDATMSEAVAAGLFHPNCLHSVTVYVPGLTDKAGMKERAGYTREQDAEGYGNRQQQRYMERCARQWKRRQAVATTPEDERLAKAYVDKWQMKLRELTGDKGLPRQYRREGGRVKLSEAAKKLKPLKFAADGGIIYSADYTDWLRAGYDRAVENGDISALTGFEHYQKVARQVERELVGLTTSDGIRIEGYKTHFVDRIIGSYTKKREPVDIQDAKNALLSPDDMDRRRPKDPAKHNDVYKNEKCWVSVNPNTAMLIQASPKERAK